MRTGEYILSKTLLSRKSTGRNMKRNILLSRKKKESNTLIKEQDGIAKGINSYQGRGQEGISIFS
jgi:hypothetical protein